MFSRILLASVCLVALVAAKDKTGIEGKWELDKSKTGSAIEGGPLDLETEIKQKGNSIVVASKYKEPANGVYPIAWIGIMAYEMKFNSDGSDTVTGLGPFQHKSKTTMNGSTMTTDWVAQTEVGNSTGQWVRTVSPDGKEMTLQIKSKISDGRTVDKTLYFKRK